MAEKGNPNVGKQLNFVPKAWDEKAGEYRPFYIAPDATDKIAGDVYLTDDIPEDIDQLTADELNLINAEKGITAMTPLGLGKFKKEIEKAGVNLTTHKLDATKLDGIIPLDNIPHGAKERLFTFESLDDATSHFGDGADEIQVGDTVRIPIEGKEDAFKLYYVSDSDNDGVPEFHEYSAGNVFNYGTDGYVPGPTELADGEEEERFLKANGQWEVVKSGVTGVRGVNEPLDENDLPVFRTGNVELSAQDIGALGWVNKTRTEIDAENNELIIDYKDVIIPESNIETNIGTLEEPFHNLFIDNIYAGHIFLKKDAFNDLDFGDLTVGKAKLLDQVLTFTGDVEGQVDLSEPGDKEVSITGTNSAPEIAIQEEQPDPEEQVKIWVKVTGA